MAILIWKADTKLAASFQAGDTVRIQGISANALSFNLQSNTFVFSAPSASLSLQGTGVLSLGDLATLSFTFDDGSRLSYVPSTDFFAGTDSNELFIGSDLANWISARNGDNTIYGFGGNDKLVGGSGIDQLWGGTGNDTLYGGDGNDLLFGEDGDDQLSGEAGNDKLDGGAGADTLDGGLGDDSLYGGSGNDTLVGGGGKDSLYGGDGDDTLRSSYGSDLIGDLLDGGNGNDQLIGGAGDDLLQGGAGDDNLSGNAGADQLFGGDGNDLITGGTGNDKLYGGSGNDSLFTNRFFDSASNQWIDDALDDLLDGGDGNDTLQAGAGNDILLGGAGNDNLSGGAGNDQLFGGTGDDTLDGGDGNDLLDGGGGKDMLIGGDGDDSYVIYDRNTIIRDSNGKDTALVKVNWFKPIAAIENWTYAPGVEKLPYWIDSLTFESQRVNDTGPKKILYFCFAEKSASFFSTIDSQQFSPFNTAQREYARKVFTYIATVLNIEYREVSNPETADCLVLGNNFQANSGAYGTSRVLMVNNVNPNFQPSASFYELLLHEVGHGLGLKHPFAHADADGSIGAGPYLPSAEENTDLTLMSYTGTTQHQYQLAYRAFDLAALQSIYGPSTQLNAGDTVYKLEATKSLMIGDGQGKDVIDGSALKQNLTLYLEPGYWSFVGTKADLISAAGQFTINFGTTIEDAIGGSGNDILIGNAANNTLAGGDGDDQLDGGDGADSLQGGSGNDVAIYHGNLNAYQIQREVSGFTVTEKLQVSNRDSLNQIEKIKFTDFSVNLVVADNAKTIASTDLTRIEELYVAFFNRTPDADGLNYWITQFKNGLNISKIAESFYAAAIQFSDLTGYTASMSNEDFVRIIYKNVLGRSGATAPPDEDVNYWAGNLKSGTVSKGQLVSTMLYSAHTFKGDKTWGWVADLLDNKIYVANYFAVQNGLNYNSDQESITKGVAIASAVTPTDTSAAIQLIGLASDVIAI